MSSSPNHSGSSAKRRKGNDGTVVGFLSSWLGYFTGPRDNDDDSAQHMLARSEQMMERTEKLMHKIEEKLEKLEGSQNEQMMERTEILVQNREEKLESLENSRSEQMMERMEKLMHNMEEKLESLEDREKNEESSKEECSSEGESSSEDESDENSDDWRLDAYKEMVAKNKNDWEYSAGNLTISEDIARSLANYELPDIQRLYESIRNCTIKMRRGEYHHEGMVLELGERYEIDTNLQGVLLGPYEYNIEADLEPVRYIMSLKPHWEEFAQALDDFDLILDVMPDDTESCFQLSQMELPATVLSMIVKSLSGKRFRHYKFVRNELGIYGIRSVIDLLGSNPELRSLTLSCNRIDYDDVVDLTQAIVSHSTLTKVNLDGCLEGAGSHCLCWLTLPNRLVEISMRNNSMSMEDAEQRQFLVESLTSNTSLERLDLRGNNFNDEDAAVFASPLVANKTLKYLLLAGNDFTRSIADEYFGTALETNNTLEYLKLDDRPAFEMFQAFQTASMRTILSAALFDEASLNSASDSNHNCCVDCCPFNALNTQGDPRGNRQRKIYNILSSRNKKMSNVQHFDDIDLNLLPEVLSAVRLYANTAAFGWFYFSDIRVPALSIVYELMRKWDKALSIYKALGNSDNY